MGSEIRQQVSSLSADRRAEVLRLLRRRETSVIAEKGRHPDHYDVVVLGGGAGGGAAGLTLALQLARSRPTTRVLVVERRSQPAPEAIHKVGESTVEIAAHYLRDVLDLDDHLRKSQLTKFGLRMFFSDGQNDDLARRLEIGSTVFPPLRTYQVDRGRLENALAAELEGTDVELLIDARVTDVTLATDAEPHRVGVSGPTGRRSVTAGWVVDASGRNRVLQHQLGLGKAVGHRANACWFRVATQIDVKQWTDDPEWHARVETGDRALSTNHLMGDGYWVWLIRLASGSTSVGIVTDDERHAFDGLNRLDRALEWLRRHEPQCASAIAADRELIQDFRVMKNYSYSCEQAYSGAARWALVGEAAVFLDPLYSPGLDMIAIGNGLAADLILRQLDGEDVRQRAAIHDRLFRTIAQIWLGVYEGQYSLMGNSGVMVSKIIWDTAFYWGVFGHLYFHDRLSAVVEDPTIAVGMARLGDISNRVQLFFREWNTLRLSGADVQFVDLYAPLDFMIELHESMAAELSPHEVQQRFQANIRLFEQLAGQMISAVIERCVDQADDQAAFDQIRRWQSDGLVIELLRTYRRNRDSRPTADGWLPAATRTLEATR